VSITLTVILILVGIVAVVLVTGAIYGRSRPLDPLNPITGLAYLLGRHYAKTVHQLRIYEDAGTLDELTGPLIVVCNHTAGVDPLLVSLSMPTRVRWLMADDMRLPWLDWFWKWHGIIFIARNRHGRTGLRKARKHLNENGIIGIFPEGRIERPAKQLLPFAPGVGVLVRRSGARVLPVVIDGTPQVEPAWNALWTASNASVHFHSVIDYNDSDMSAAEITDDIQRRFQEWTGWPMSTKRVSSSAATKPTEQALQEPETDIDSGLARNIA
jgi:1-acyl-sn-glycerol-3-phosphate acyltransferase